MTEPNTNTPNTNNNPQPEVAQSPEVITPDSLADQMDELLSIAPHVRTDERRGIITLAYEPKESHYVNGVGRMQKEDGTTYYHMALPGNQGPNYFTWERGGSAVKCSGGEGREPGQVELQDGPGISKSAVLGTLDTLLEGEHVQAVRENAKVAKQGALRRRLGRMARSVLPGNNKAA